MARFSHLPIYKASFNLLVYIEDIVIYMEKKARYTIWSDLRNITREFVVSIARVNTMKSTQRLETMLLMFDLINQIYILLSVMKELKLFKKSSDYEKIIIYVFEIEKQLEWWKKSTLNS